MALSLPFHQVYSMSHPNWPYHQSKWCMTERTPLETTLIELLGLGWDGLEPCQMVPRGKGRSPLFLRFAFHVCSSSAPTRFSSSSFFESEKRRKARQTVPRQASISVPSELKTAFKVGLWGVWKNGVFRWSVWFQSASSSKDWKLFPPSPSSPL